LIPARGAAARGARADAAARASFRPVAAPLAGDPGPGLFGPIPWTGGGLEVCTTISGQVLPTAVSDNSGGVIAAWLDYRNGQSELFGMRLDGNGNRLWPAAGVALAQPGEQLDQPLAMPDGANGAFVIVPVGGIAGYSDLLVQRVTSTGAIAGGWLANGRSTAPGGATGFGAVPTNDGNLLMGWNDPDGQIRLVRLTGAGALASGWNAAGLAVGPTANEGTISAAPDGAGGAYLAWGQTDAIVLTRVTSGGTFAPGWTAAGTVVVSGFTVIATGIGTALLTSGDVMVFWPDFRSLTSIDIYAMRFTAAGAPAPGWNATGVPAVVDPNQDFEPFGVSDAAGGALVVCGAGTDSMVAQRVTSTGAISPGWPAAGVTLHRHQGAIPALPISDGEDGVIFAWSANLGADYDIYAQRATAGALATGWPNGGRVISGATGDQQIPVIVPDGASGVIAVWEDSRDPLYPAIFAGKVGADGVVPALAALVSASAEPGLARLHWFSPDGAFEAGVERASGAQEFAEIARVRSEAGHVRYDDRSVSAGETYRYRLALVEDGTKRYFGAVTLRVPDGARLALAGFVPNPAVGAPSLAYTLPTAERARIEVLDTAGRRVHARELESTPGEHVVTFDSVALGPGVYLLRLTQGARTVTARATIVR
jgi:hypothetical protein